MRIFKFGGASVKNADAIRNLAGIVKNTEGELVVVISALGKTTNKLEHILKQYIIHNDTCFSLFNDLKAEHFEIAIQLLGSEHSFLREMEHEFMKLHSNLVVKYSGNYDYHYDQIVHFGEIFSTKLISAYLNTGNVKNNWIDIRCCLKTDSNYREANVDYLVSQKMVQQSFNFESNSMFITQGFIASDHHGNPVTLGREGSDYTAALLANLLDAESTTIWKDVPGVLNADPKIFEKAVKLEELSYLEAIELAYSGAQVIHPKTIKPLQNKNIPLYVKSFINSNGGGTIIKEKAADPVKTPIYILKKEQVLVSIKPKDFSFVLEECMSQIFGHFFENRIKVNMIQTSAVSFSVCVDTDERKLPLLLDKLKEDYSVRYNDNLDLITVRHYTPEFVNEVLGQKEILLEQKSRNTTRLVVRG